VTLWVVSRACLDCVQVEQSEPSPVRNGDGDEMMESSSPSPLSPEPGSDGHVSNPDESSSASNFVRNAARKSLGNGLSMQKWFFAQEKVMEQHQYEVGAGCWVWFCYCVTCCSAEHLMNMYFSCIFCPLSHKVLPSYVYSNGIFCYWRALLYFHHQ